MDKFEHNTEITDTQPVPSYGLLYITRAYNQGEITLEEWLVLSQAWAEAMLQQQKQHETIEPD
jgi:hypothetical protein